MGDTPAGSTELRCAGLLHEGTRPLSNDERGAIVAEANRARRRGWLCILAIPFGLGILIALGYALERWIPAFVFGGAAAVYCLLGTAIFLSLALDRFRWSRGLRKDAGEGFVHRFEGVVAEGRAFEPTLRALQKRALLMPDASRRRELEVLPASSLIWRVDGARPQGWIPALVARTGKTPDAASVAAQWVRPAVAPGRRLVFVNQRSLSPQEISEITRLVRQGIPRLLFEALLLVVTLNAGLLQVRGPEHGVLDVVLLLAGVYFASLMVREIQARWKLRKDARGGRVVIARAPVPGEGPDAGPVPGATLEFLPASSVPWTLDGAPAAWRTRGYGTARSLIPRDKPEQA